MTINTCSGALSFAKGLENESAKFYENSAQQYTKEKDLFLSFVKENGEYIIQIERAYYGVISDAIEGCFAFNIDPEKYTFEKGLSEQPGLSDVIKKALEIEEKIVLFYSDAAEQSKSLMADVPRVFKMVAKKRGLRKEKLLSLMAAKA
jgi:rubrerythrin